jgi:UDP-N-acetylmuramate dehydrogenase
MFFIASLSMFVQENFSLRAFNTFGLDVRARFFVEVHTVDELREVLTRYHYSEQPLLILGGGSNLLFTRDFEGLAIKMSIGDITQVAETDEHVWLKSGAGTVWHDLVIYSVQHGWGGIENLSLIPGTVGAAPIQNIGAYGVELKDCFEQLEALEIATGKLHTFTHEACRFGYRDSFFKQAGKGRFIIVSVTLRLQKKPVFRLSYGAVQTTLEQMNALDHLTPEAVSAAVCHIRRSKLPDPAKIGNAGSFFKNPEIPNHQFDTLKEQYPNIVAFPAAHADHTKLAAGWLIEQCGWKGFREGDAGIHRDQALVLVNYGQATGQQLIDLAMRVSDSVAERFGVRLHPEVNVV